MATSVTRKPLIFLLALLVNLSHRSVTTTAWRVPSGSASGPRSGSVARHLILRGTPWAQPEDEPDFMPKTYKPDLDFPGTLRPGTTPENDPMDSLPQYILHRPPNYLQIPWHVRWGAPHGASIPIESFIEQIGRWQTEEDLDAEERAAVEALEATQPSLLDVLEPDDMLGEDDTSLIEGALGLRNDNDGDIGLGAQ